MASCTSNCCTFVCLFFCLFCVVYYLESISGTYIISVIQSIEKQFQIPSKMSGSLISAQDVGYVPTVVILSYLGSRGNRARWIGGGCILIAVANLIISTPNFLFPDKPPVMNDTAMDYILTPSFNNQSIDQSLIYALKNRYISADTYRQLIDEIGTDQYRADWAAYANKKLENNDFDDSVRDLLADYSSRSELADRFKKMLFANDLPDQRKNEIILTSAAPIGHCDATVNRMKQLVHDTKCEQGETNMAAFGIVFVALILLGVGHSMPWSLGVPLIDDNVKRTSLPTYFAFMFFIKILGPISGFFIGGACNRLYYTLEDSGGLEPKDPRWIGAWWLGFIIIAAVLIGPAIGLFCFPTQASKKVEQSLTANGEPNNTNNSRTPAKERSQVVSLVDKHKATRESYARNLKTQAAAASGAEENKLWHELKTFGTAVVTILSCPVYFFSLCGRIFDAFAFKGFFAFLPKYLDNHYGIPQYKANMYLGSFGIVGFAGGMLIGSVIMRKFKLEGRRAAAFVAFCTLTGALVSVSKVFLGCESVTNSIGSTGVQQDFNFTTSCNRDCFCDPVKLLPVCSQSGQVYYSPCHAGCTQMTAIEGRKESNFTNCLCVDVGTQVSREWCNDDCDPKIVAYFIMATISGLIGGFGVVPGVLIVLRSVPPEWRSISIGFSGFIVSIGTFFSPPFFGFIIDSTCLLWETTCGGEQGSCLIYEPSQLRNRLHIVYGSLRAIGWVFDLFVFYYAKDLQLMSGGDQEPVAMQVPDIHVEQFENLTIEEEEDGLRQERKPSVIMVNGEDLSDTLQHVDIGRPTDDVSKHMGF